MNIFVYFTLFASYLQIVYYMSMKTSVYKQQIVDLLNEHHTLNIQSLCDYLHKPDFSTVFRNVEQLVNDGILKKIVIDTKCCVYELASHNHGHYICTNCKKIETIDVHDIPISSGSIKDITVSGICTSCTK